MDLNLKWCWNLLAEGAILFWNCIRIEGLFQTITTAFFQIDISKGMHKVRHVLIMFFQIDITILIFVKWIRHVHKDISASLYTFVVNFLHIQRNFTHSLHSLHSLHNTAYNYTTSVICLHLPYICPITHICFQHLPSLLCIDCTD